MMGLYLPTTGSWFYIHRVSITALTTIAEGTNGQRNDLELSSLRIFYKPRPTTALDSSKVGVESLLELVEASPSLVDGRGELTTRGLSSTILLGGEILPEKGVVDMPTVHTPSVQAI